MLAIFLAAGDDLGRYRLTEFCGLCEIRGGHHSDAEQFIEASLSELLRRGGSDPRKILDRRLWFAGLILRGCGHRFLLLLLRLRGHVFASCSRNPPRYMNHRTTVLRSWTRFFLSG